MIQNFFSLFPDKKDKKESKPTKQTSSSSATGRQEQQGHSSGPSQSQNWPSLQQSEWQTLGRAPAMNLLQRPQNLQEDEWSQKQAQPFCRTEQGPGERGSQSQKQAQQKQVQLHSEQGAWQPDRGKNCKFKNKTYTLKHCDRFNP